MLNKSGKAKLALKTIVKLILAIVISCVAMFSLLFVMFKPVYEVKLEGQTLGYISNKADVQKQINDFIQNGDKENVGYVILKDEPTYEFNFVKKDAYINEEEIVAKVIDKCDVYYRIYGVNVDDEEKFVVDTIKEAQEIADKLNEAQDSYEKQSVIEISEKFVQEYTMPEDIEVAVNDIETVLKKNNDKYLKEHTKKQTVTYAASTYVVPEEILLAMSESGRSLSFRNPLDRSYVVTSRYGIRSRDDHKGIDLAVPTGTPIYASEDGVVVYSGWCGGYGYLVRIQHGNGYETYYGQIEDNYNLMANI